MAIFYNKSGKTIPGISGNSFDYVRSFAASRVTDPILIDELVQAYVLIAQNLGITPVQFIQQVTAQGTSQDQDIFLASQLNNVRVKNALIGVGNNQSTPVFVQREINP